MLQYASVVLICNVDVGYTYVMYACVTTVRFCHCIVKRQLSQKKTYAIPKLLIMIAIISGSGI